MSPTARRSGAPTLVALPNPSRQPHVTLSFSLVEAAHTTLEIFDVSGRRVATLHEGRMEAGSHEVVWRAPSAASGIYFGRLHVGTDVGIRRFVRLR